MEEIWKDIPGYEGLYQASTLGRIKSFKLLKERILNPFLHHSGYLKVNLRCKDLRLKKFSVHQLIAITFLDFKPSGMEYVIDHLDSNPLNNRLDNIRVVTNRENISKERSTNRSLPIGVYNCNSLINPYRSYIVIKEKQIPLGVFKTPEEASEAYQNALRNLNP